MARRSIGQEPFGFLGGGRTTSSLDTLASLVDWAPIAALLDPLYPAAKGEPAWPPLGKRGLEAADQAASAIGS